MQEEEQQKGGYQSHTDAFSRFTVTISKEVWNTLKERAEDEKRNKSYFVEEALKYYFSHPPGAVQQEQQASSSPHDESSELQDSFNLILERLNQQQVQIETFSDSLNQVSERTESFQNQIDAVKMQAEKLSQVSIKPPAVKTNPAQKRTPAEIEDLLNKIQSINDIQPDGFYSPSEAFAILRSLLKNPDADRIQSTSALNQRINRGFKEWNLKSEDIGYRDDEGYHIKGSYLILHIKKESEN